MVLSKNTWLLPQYQQVFVESLLPSQLDAGIQMRILFSHNFPAQFRRLAPALSNEGHDVVFWRKILSGMLRLVMGLGSRSTRSIVTAEEKLYTLTYGDSNHVCSRVRLLSRLRPVEARGMGPDWIINHVGFGNGLYLSDAFPDARRIGLFEWYYNARGADVDFLRRGPLNQIGPRLRTWNAQTLLEIADCDYGVVPTNWQLNQFPPIYVLGCT